MKHCKSFRDVWLWWRDLLVWNWWDDVLVTAVLIFAPLFGCLIAWQCLTIPHIANANPNVKTIDEVPVSVQVDVKRGCVVYRRLGPRD